MRYPDGARVRSRRLQRRELRLALDHMLIATFADLIKLLESEKIPHHADEKLQFVEMPTHSPPLEGSMAIVWDRTDNLVQFIHIYRKPSTSSVCGGLTSPPEM